MASAPTCLCSATNNSPMNVALAEVIELIRQRNHSHIDRLRTADVLRNALELVLYLVDTAWMFVGEM